MCTILRDIVRDSIELQYIIQLAADGMVDGIGCNLSTAERLARLLQLRARWRSLEWTRVITISTPVSFQQCVVDGVYASMPEVDNPSRRLTLTCLSSNGDVEVPRVLQMEDTEENIHAFALDPSQNLVVLLLEEDPLVYVFRSYEVRIATHSLQPSVFGTVQPCVYGHCAGTRIILMPPTQLSEQFSLPMCH